MIQTGIACLAAALFLVLLSLAGVKPLSAPAGGRRALARQRGLARNPWFGPVEPAIRRFAAILAPLISERVRGPLDKHLVAAGSPLGLSAPEFVAASMLCSGLGASAGLAYVNWLGDAIAPWLGAGVMGTLPWLRVRGVRLARMQAISRALPGAIDICALCMNGGLDFTASLEQFIAQAADPQGPLVEELRQVLRAMTLGSTRSQALQALAEAAPIPSVRQLVEAIIQGERKGTPLVEVLTIQARALRQSRSVAAEEAAARAAALLVLPLLLLMGCVMLIMIGPFAVEGFGL